MVDWALLLVKFVHVLSGMAWLGSAAVLGFLAQREVAEALQPRTVRRWLHAAHLFLVPTRGVLYRGRLSARR